MFHDRGGELETLHKEYTADRFSFIVLYGRRRVGKTELIKKFCEDKPHIYHLATQDSEKLQREKLVEEIAEHYDERTPKTSTWSDASGYIAEKLSKDKIILAIDEFPYLVDSNQNIVSQFQRLIDEELQNSNSTLIISGSSISIMESEILGHKSPLYGRRTAQIDLQPFNFREANQVISYGLEDSITSYSITGGTPMYLNMFDYSKQIKHNVLENPLSKNSVLYNEPEFLIRAELRNPSRYMSILESIANGYTTPKEISGNTDIDTGPLSNYLQKLRRLRLIERIIPVTESRKKSKRSIYRIRDSYLRFWFRFVEPNRSGIEENPEAIYEAQIEPNLNIYTAKTFETICMEMVWQMNQKKEPTTSYSKVGKWWYGENELDVVALNEANDQILFGESKWTSNPVDTSVLNHLENTSEEVRWRNDTRTPTYALFSKSGFTDDILETQKTRNDLILHDLKTINKLTQT